MLLNDFGNIYLIKK